jgi:hypothetical protein
LDGDSGGGVRSYLARWYARDNDIVFADSAERVQVGIIGVLTQVFVLFIEHHPRGRKFDREGANPPYTIIFTAKSATRHLGGIRRRHRREGCDSVALRFSNGRKTTVEVAYERCIVAWLSLANNLAGGRSCSMLSSLG